MDTQQQSTGTEAIQAEDFKNTYANNAQFETSVWDLKIIFGQLDQKLGPNSVVQHTAVTLPWPHVKVMLYFLRVNLMVHEHLNGRVKVPAGVLLDPEKIRRGAAAYPGGEEIADLLSEFYEDFVRDNPEAAGEPKPKKKQ